MQQSMKVANTVPCGMPPGGVRRRRRGRRSRLAASAAGVSGRPTKDEGAHRALEEREHRARERDARVAAHGRDRAPGATRDEPATAQHRGGAGNAAAAGDACSAAASANGGDEALAASSSGSTAATAAASAVASTTARRRRRRSASARCRTARHRRGQCCTRSSPTTATEADPAARKRDDGEVERRGEPAKVDARLVRVLEDLLELAPLAPRGGAAPQRRSGKRLTSACATTPAPIATSELPKVCAPQMRCSSSGSKPRTRCSHASHASNTVKSSDVETPPSSLPKSRQPYELTCFVQHATM